MRIFISHSSQDRWIARQLDLRLRGCGNVDTFLDEQDIEGGDSITETVRTELRRCHELVVLLSSASAKSDWVRAEMGAAWALGKRIVILLEKLHASEVSPVFRDYKTFDLNEVERYLAEVGSRARSARTRKK